MSSEKSKLKIKVSRSLSCLYTKVFSKLRFNPTPVPPDVSGTMNSLVTLLSRDQIHDLCVRNLKEVHGNETTLVLTIKFLYKEFLPSLVSGQRSSIFPSETVSCLGPKAKPTWRMVNTLQPVQ